MRKIFLLLCLFPALSLGQNWPHRSQETLADRFPPPNGYRRLSLESGGFGTFLRELPLKPKGTKVLLFDGSPKKHQLAQAAVVDLDLDPQDLQQCADAVMRLRAEYLLGAGKEDEIEFLTAAGGRLDWSQWKEERGSEGNYRDFRKYLRKVFGLANSVSLGKQMVPVVDGSWIRPGDAFVKGGYPGHAVLVLDVAANEEGERVFLLGQSYMPAQDFHVLKNPLSTLSPWYKAKGKGTLITPEWVFDWENLRRFSVP